MHNVYNSLAAIAACHIVGCSILDIKRGLNKFAGTHRRFELKGVFNNVKIIDDYAHHPSEIKATLKAAKVITVLGYGVFSNHIHILGQKYF